MSVKLPMFVSLMIEEDDYLLVPLKDAASCVHSMRQFGSSQHAQAEMMY